MNYGTKLFGKKWRIAIFNVLKNGPLRFSQIKASLPGCSVKVLSEALQEMEAHHLIKRRQYPTIPVKVTYELQEHILPFIHVIEKYRQLMIVHLYRLRVEYELPPEVVKDLSLQIEEQLTEK